MAEVYWIINFIMSNPSLFFVTKMSQKKPFNHLINAEIRNNQAVIN